MDKLLNRLFKAVTLILLVGMTSVMGSLTFKVNRLQSDAVDTQQTLKEVRIQLDSAKSMIEKLREVHPSIKK